MTVVFVAVCLSLLAPLVIIFVIRGIAGYKPE
jgi:hypothetical protein